MNNRLVKFFTALLLLLFGVIGFNMLTSEIIEKKSLLANHTYVLGEIVNKELTKFYTPKGGHQVGYQISVIYRFDEFEYNKSFSLLESQYNEWDLGQLVLVLIDKSYAYNSELHLEVRKPTETFFWIKTFSILFGLLISIGIIVLFQSMMSRT